MRAFIDSANHIVLVAHMHPDADSLGSACAMYAHLLRLHKPVTLFCADETIDERLDCIPWCEALTSKWDEKADLAIAFDCGSAVRLGVRPHCRLINVDHHADNSGYGDINMIDADAPSTTAILMQWFKAEGIKINAKMATALFAGIAEDTMAFLSRRTDASVFEMAAELTRLGADVARVNHDLFMRRPLSWFRLKGMLFQQMELVSDGRIVLLQVPRVLQERSGAEACDSALHEALGLPTIKVAVLLRELEDGSIKGSLRTDDGIDVSAIAVAYGGGGHHFAAGFIVHDMPMAHVRESVIANIEKEFE